jgi:hypothetical protein
LKSKALPSFWKCFEKLPTEIQELAREKYRLWTEHPFHAVGYLIGSSSFFLRGRASLCLVFGA